jgi:HprK-related kinase A
VTLHDLDPRERRRRLTGPGLALQVGPFSIRLTSGFRAVDAHLASHYRDFPVLDQSATHFSMAVRPPSLLRRYVRPQALFTVNGRTPFTNAPARLAHGVFEWGFNWAVGRTAHQWVVVHAAVVERDGHALLLPAAPGSGKSTLCAALAHAGWRLLSDELTIVDSRTGDIVPIPRPIALKGPSIDVIRRRVPDARFGASLVGVTERVARHLAPPSTAVALQHVRARPAWIVVPKWQAGVPFRLEPVERARMTAHLADSSFNYNLVGPAGFQRLLDLADE